LIIKSDNKVLVEKFHHKNFYYVKKSERSNRNLLRREYLVATHLAERWEFYKERFPLVDSAIFGEANPHPFCYYLKYIDLPNLSTHISVNVDSELLLHALGVIYHKLEDQVLLEANANSASDDRYLMYALRRELLDLESQTELRRIMHTEAYMEGERYRSIYAMLIEIFPSLVDLPMRPYLDLPNSSFYHYNFHGGNILVDLNSPEEFKIIDPDPSIEGLDPIFGLARFLYTPVHDFAYKVNFSSTDSANRMLFELTENSKKFELSNAHIFNFFSKALSRKFQRSSCLRDNYILCLLRGIRANFLGQNSATTIQPHLYISRQLSLFLNSIT
jgi:hypothetical protein